MEVTKELSDAMDKCRQACQQTHEAECRVRDAQFKLESERKRLVEVVDNEKVARERVMMLVTGRTIGAYEMRDFLPPFPTGPGIIRDIEAIKSKKGK
jgi:mRNA-degrading endonuclease HigB of HigAB toxin-antitoxin module